MSHAYYSKNLSCPGLFHDYYSNIFLANCSQIFQAHCWKLFFTHYSKTFQDSRIIHVRYWKISQAHQATIKCLILITKNITGSLPKHVFLLITTKYFSLISQKYSTFIIQKRFYAYYSKISYSHESIILHPCNSKKLDSHDSKLIHALLLKHVWYLLVKLFSCSELKDLPCAR